MSTHEDFSRKNTIKGASDRSFGIVFTAVFALIFFSPLIHRHPVRLWALPIAAGFLLVTIFRPSLLHGMNRVWTKLALLLNKVMNPLVMGLFFYLIITPIAILFRLRGKDLLRLRKDPNTSTYWIHRQPPGPAPETMANQF